MEVPDEVAAVIENDNALEPVPNPAPTPGTAEIPFFDLVEMGLPTIVPDVTGTGNKVSTWGDFTELLNAMEKGAVRVRVAIQTNAGVSFTTSLCMPVCVESANLTFWQLNAIATTDYKSPTMRASIHVYKDGYSNSEGDTGDWMTAHCAMLQHFTM